MMEARAIGVHLCTPPPRCVTGAALRPPKGGHLRRPRCPHIRGHTRTKTQLVVMVVMRVRARGLHSVRRLRGLPTISQRSPDTIPHVHRCRG